MARSRADADFKAYVTVLGAFAGREWTVGELCLVRSYLPKSGVRGEQPRYETLVSWALGAGTRAGTGAVNLDGVNPKTRNRIMAGVLVLMFVVVAVAAAVR